ncbi:MAG: septum formation inhibitor Maf [Proteobacteria bacterium]|nr:septum formation inhibitor Maf [Pseudomonadota bacterium]
MLHLPNIYLASSSPRRQELLTQIGVTFELLPVSIDENKAVHESPLEMAERLALLKAGAGWQHSLRKKNLPVLGADTIIVLEQQVLGKPIDRKDGIQMLKQLSGKQHQVITAIAIILNETVKTEISTTKVFFREMSDAECEAYWETGEPCDKAGGYAIQGLGAMFISKIEGSYSGVVGLPLFETSKLLKTFHEKLI